MAFCARWAFCLSLSIFTASLARLLVAFNDNKENAVTMESFQLNDAHNQYDFLSGEARKQLMVGHRITSPMLFGIKDNTGLGNNAEELETASRLLDATVIRPKQNNILKKKQLYLKRK